MASKLRTKTGQAAYASRKAIGEPASGQIATLQGKHVLLRGLDEARGEWTLLAACHNLRKLHGHLGPARVGKPPAGHLRHLDAVRAPTGPTASHTRPSKTATSPLRLKTPTVTPPHRKPAINLLARSGPRS
jgi:hypothetical protein